VALDMDEMEREALLLLGSIFLRTGKFDRAVQVYEGLEEAAPRDRQVLKNLSFALIRAGRYDQALPRAEAFLQNAQLSPDERLWGTFLKMHALWGMGREPEWKRAIDEFAGLRASAGTPAPTPAQAAAQR